MIKCQESKVGIITGSVGMPYVKDKGGLCPLCSRRVGILEKHHVCYDPEKLIGICHGCHFKIHHNPGKMKMNMRLLLEHLRGKDCRRSWRVKDHG